MDCPRADMTTGPNERARRVESEEEIYQWTERPEGSDSGPRGKHSFLKLEKVMGMQTL